jgi:hypothetical protein
MEMNEAPDSHQGATFRIYSAGGLLREKIILAIRRLFDGLLKILLREDAAADP